MKIKAIVLAFILSLMLFTSTVFAQLKSDTFGSTRIDQITYGASPVWKVTNISPSSTVVRFTQPSGFTATLFLASGESTSLGNFEAYYEWTCSAGYTPVVVATGSQPIYSDHVADNVTTCRPN